MSLTLITPPAAEPVTLAEMRAFLKVDDTAEDALITQLISAARVLIEGALRRPLVEQVWRMGLDRWPQDHRIIPPLEPLIAVDAIRLYNTAGQASVLNASLYRIDRVSLPDCIVIDPAAPTPERAFAALEIDLRVGYGTAAQVPDPIRHAIRLMVARWFENRGEATETSLPNDILALIARYRKVRVR